MTKVVVEVELQGKASHLSSALNVAGKQVISFTNTLKAGFGLNIGARLADRLLALPATIKANIDQATSFAGQLNDLSRAANMASEPFQVLSRSAKQSGAEMGMVTNGIVVLGEKARDALSGDRGAAGAFAQLGIDVQSFINLAPERQIEAVGTALNSAKDPAAAFSAVMELLGTKNAPRLRAMLEELGSKGLNKLAQDMIDSGLMMREHVIERLDEAGDKADDNASRFRNAWAELGSALKPVLDALRQLGTWGANILSRIALGFEKIGIAAGTFGAMMTDIFEGQYKGLKFYNDQAERLAAEAEKRRNAPLAGTKTTPTNTDPLVAKGTSKASLEEVARRAQIAERDAAVQLASISRSFTMTNEEKRRATLKVLAAQADEITKAQKDLDATIEKLAKADPRFAALAKANPSMSTVGIATELAAGGANPELAGAITARDRLTDAQSGVTQARLGAMQDPLNVQEGITAGLTDIESRWGSLAQQMRASIGDIGTAISGSLGGAMNQLLGTTELWTQRLGNIAGPIMGAITQSIARMAAEFITSQIIIAGIKKMLSAKNEADNKKEVTQNATAAGFKSIAQLGPILGPLAFAASAAVIIGLAGGFYQGGFTGLGNPRDPAGIVHRGEYVIPHDVTAAIGPSALSGFVDAVRNPAQPVSLSSAGGGSRGADDPWVQMPRTLFVDHREQDLIDHLTSHPKFTTKVEHIYRRTA